MGNKIKLKRSVKFRKEKNYILLCDCKNLKDYTLPLKYYSFLLELKKGIPKNKVKYKKLISDFIKLGMIEKA